MTEERTAPPPAEGAPPQQVSGELEIRSQPPGAHTDNQPSRVPQANPKHPAGYPQPERQKASANRREQPPPQQPKD